MAQVRTLVAALVTVLAGMPAGVLTACDSSTSSPAPTSAASKADFCRTFEHLGPDTSPRQAAEELSRVGTPGDIDSGARHGFEVLVDHLREWPEGTHARRLTQLVRTLNDEDAADVRAFLIYYAQECQGFAGDQS